MLFAFIQLQISIKLSIKIANLLGISCEHHIRASTKSMYLYIDIVLPGIQHALSLSILYINTSSYHTYATITFYHPFSFFYFRIIVVVLHAKRKNVANKLRKISFQKKTFQMVFKSQIKRLFSFIFLNDFKQFSNATIQLFTYRFDMV